LWEGGGELNPYIPEDSRTMAIDGGIKIHYNIGLLGQIGGAAKKSCSGSARRTRSTNIRINMQAILVRCTTIGPWIVTDYEIEMEIRIM